MFTQSSVASVSVLKISRLCSRMICPCFSICFLVFQKGCCVPWRRACWPSDAVFRQPLRKHCMTPSRSTSSGPHAALRQAGWGIGWTNFETDYRKNTKWNAAKMRSGFGYLIKYLCFSRKCIGTIIYFAKWSRTTWFLLPLFFKKKRQNEWNLEWNMFWVKSLYSK